MERRGLLQGVLAAGLWSIFSGRGTAAQPVVKDMKGIEELQKNWKLLPGGRRQGAARRRSR